MSRTQLRDVMVFMVATRQPDGDTGMNDGGKARAMQSVAGESAAGGH
jgi:hypothetical protein